MASRLLKNLLAARRATAGEGHQRAVPPLRSADEGKKVGVGEGNAAAAGGEDPAGVDEAERCLVGRYIGRSSSGRGRILVVGKVPSRDSTTKLYSVMVEGGNDEDLGLPRLRELLLITVPDMKVSCRKKRKLDLLVSSGGGVSGVKGPPKTRHKVVDARELSTIHSALQETGSGPDVPEEDKTSCNSFDFSKETPSDPLVKAVELPPSSGDLAVPEEAVTILFYVYKFLRSFSVQLFLSPFGLDDFVAAVNCNVQNNLLDAVHVSLLRALRRQLETRSAEGSQLASNCLKYLDWTLLDVLTWPTFLLEYLCVMGCLKNLGGQTFGRNLLAIEYYELPVVMKLRVLQILCDHVTDSEGYSEELEYEIVSSGLPEAGSRAVSTSGYKRINAVVANASQNGNFEDCRICGMGGTLVCCDGCPWAYHSRCICLNKACLSQGKWFCPECVVDKLGTTSSSNQCGARGDKIFGIDVFKRVFLGSFNYLLVIGKSSNDESYARYYNHHDVVKVLQILAPSDSYTNICGRMMEYWKHLRDIFHRERSKKGKEVCRHTLSAQNSIHNAPINGASGPSAISRHNESVILGVSNMAQSLFHPVLSTSISGLGTVNVGKPAKLLPFRPQAYINLYTHGNIAASAAANLAVITSEVSASQLATNRKKKIATENALQLKAFSTAAAQFVWPRTKKKLMEVPRDRCGWCLACRSSAIGNKKACFLNTAAANAAKGSAWVLSAMRLIKNSDSNFTSIVAYLASMEESLRGLLVGSLQHIKQKQQWHKQLQEASNCRSVAPLLLELESNISGIAFSTSWSKLIDEWPAESLGLSTGASCHAGYQKCGAGGRRGEKRVFAFESEMATEEDYKWTWWCGGNISKRICQRGAHLSSIIRKAARQGGKKRIASISYHEDSNLPRHTRQFAWRVWVGLSQNSSQLALQVRYLDAHIRWKEFVPPDQIPLGGEVPDVDFYSLRNAIICDKKIVDNRIRYALKFPNQNHLPDHVTANILEVEDNQDENNKLWFSENHVPLYMVREFEQNAGARSLPVPGMLDGNGFTSFCPRRVKAFTGDVFSYLFQKGEVYPCATCKKDVPFRDVVKCSSCQGNCHKECTSRSVDSNKGSHAVPSLICNLCLRKRNIMLTSYNTNASYVRPQQKISGPQPVAASKVMFKFGSSYSAEPAVKVQGHPVAKVQVQRYNNVYAQPIMNAKAQQAAKVEASPVINVASPGVQTGRKTRKSEKPSKRKNVQAITYFGLVWKKHKNDNDGCEFRANDVILKSKDGIGSLVKPICCLCNKTYSPDLLYVRCEKCRNWFHGDALQLEEEKAVELVAYCCCRCRKRAVPHCPHSDDKTNPEPEISGQHAAMSSEPTVLSAKETSALPDQDPLVATFGTVERIGEELMDDAATLTRGGKLPTRRAPKNS